MHVHCLHWLMSTCLFLQRAFFSDNVNPQLVKWHQCRTPIWQWGPDIAPTVSTRLSKPCSGILNLCGCMWMSYIATLNSTIFVLSCFFVLAFDTTHTTPVSLLSTPYVHWPNINEFHEKNQ